MAEIKEDKLNKYSIKDRAKFIVQFYQHLFAGLKNFEAANYHQILTSAYFESILFLLVKRVQPFLEKNPEDSEDKTYL